MVGIGVLALGLFFTNMQLSNANMAIDVYEASLLDQTEELQAAQETVEALGEEKAELVTQNQALVQKNSDLKQAFERAQAGGEEGQPSLSPLELELREVKELNEILAEQYGEIVLKQDLPLLKLKLDVQYGMESELVIDRVEGETIYYRYFDVQHQWTPDKEIKTMAIEDILSMTTLGNDGPIREYQLQPYFDYGDYHVPIAVGKSFESKFIDDLDYRTFVVEQLNNKLTSKAVVYLVHPEFFATQ